MKKKPKSDEVYLEIELLKGNNLPPMDFLTSSSDPYCIFKNGSNYVKSKIIKINLSKIELNKIKTLFGMKFSICQ
jgi:hypothetical protein